MAEPYYAAVADLRADSRIDDAYNATKATEALTSAEDLVDRLVGPRTADTTTGRKFVLPGSYTAGQVAALKRATVLLAAELVLNPAAYDPPAGKTVKGPDFELTEAAALTPAAARTVRQVAELLDANRLRVKTARLR